MLRQDALQPFRQALWLGFHALRNLGKCSHYRVTVGEGKAFCPDCGQGVVCRWFLPRCGHCAAWRKARALFRQVVPEDACCPRCGNAHIRLEPLEAYRPFQALQGVFLLEDAEVYRQTQTWRQTVRVWLDSPALAR